MSKGLWKPNINAFGYIFWCDFTTPPAQASCLLASTVLLDTVALPDKEGIIAGDALWGLMLVADVSRSTVTTTPDRLVGRSNCSKMGSETALPSLGLDVTILGRRKTHTPAAQYRDTPRETLSQSYMGEAAVKWT